MKGRGSGVTLAGLIWLVGLAAAAIGCDDDTGATRAPAVQSATIRVQLPADGWDAFALRAYDAAGHEIEARQAAPGELVVFGGLADGRVRVEVDGCVDSAVTHERTRGLDVALGDERHWAPQLRPIQRLRPCGSDREWDPRELLEIEEANADTVVGRWHGDLVGLAPARFRIVWARAQGELTLELPDGIIEGWLDRDDDTSGVIVDGVPWQVGEPLPVGASALVPIAAWSWWRLPGAQHAESRLLIQVTVARLAEALMGADERHRLRQPPGTVTADCAAMSCDVITPEAGFGCVQALSGARLPILPLMDGPPPGCEIARDAEPVFKRADIDEAACGANWGACPGSCGAGCGGECEPITVFCDPRDAEDGRETTPARTCYTIDGIRPGADTPADDYNDCFDDDEHIAVTAAQACNSNECCFEHDVCNRRDRGYFERRGSFAFAALDLAAAGLLNTPPTAAGACHMLGAMACSPEGLSPDYDQWGRSYGPLTVADQDLGALLVNGAMAAFGTPRAGWTTKWFDACGHPLPMGGPRTGHGFGAAIDQVNDTVDFGTCHWARDCPDCPPQLIEHRPITRFEPTDCLVHACVHDEGTGDPNTCAGFEGDIGALEPSQAAPAGPVTFSWQVDPSESDAFGYQLQVATSGDFGAGDLLLEASFVDADVRSQPAGRRVDLPGNAAGQMLHWRVRGVFPVKEALTVRDGASDDPAIDEWAIRIGVCDVLSEVIELLAERVARQVLLAVPYVGWLIAELGVNTIEEVIERLDERCPDSWRLIHDYGAWSAPASFVWGAGEPLEGPCAGLVDGWYCGDNGPVGYPGSPDDLIYCRGGQIDADRTRDCPEGCRRNRQDQNDRCEAGPVDGAPALTYPLPNRRVTTDTPAGHAGRGVDDRNWDIDCTRFEPVASIVSGEVSRTENAVGNYVANSYGNYVCIIDAGTGLEVCQNHLETGTVAVAPGCFVQAGEYIGDCGISGAVIAQNGGDGSHIDIYAQHLDSTPFELPDPITWPVGASFDDASCRAPAPACQIPRQRAPADGAEVNPADVPVAWFEADCPPDTAESYRLQVNDGPFPAACGGDVAAQANCDIAFNETTATLGRRVRGLRPCTTYRWRVRAGHGGDDERDAAGSDFSAERTFHTRGCVDPEPGPQPEPEPEPDCGAGDVRACYTGPAQTAGVGVCRAGTQRCVGGVWGACAGDVRPLDTDTCDGEDGDCDGRVDEDPACPGDDICQRGACDDVCQPAPEMCNGSDDDCDRTVDEGVRNACGACGPVPREVCNGADDDCDGDVDEGTLNACGACGAVPAEACNGADDDCDGDTDEGGLCPAGRVCQAGECVDPRDDHTIDGCTGAHYVPGCSQDCEGCRVENGFRGVNVAGCGGFTCFQRYPNHGQDGFVFMFVRRAQTAYSRWSFPQALQGRYRIEAFIPSTAGLAEGRCGGWAISTAATYNLKVGDATVRSTAINQANQQGRWVQLFEQDATGVTSVTLGNAWPDHPGCGQVLVDAIRATPR